MYKQNLKYENVVICTLLHVHIFYIVDDGGFKVYIYNNNQDIYTCTHIYI